MGATTTTTSKVPFPPARRRWEKIFQYIEETTALNDIVVSGGDSYYLSPEHILEIGSRLLSIPHIRRFRFATRGKEFYLDTLVLVLRAFRTCRIPDENPL